MCASLLPRPSSVSSLHVINLLISVSLSAPSVPPFLFVWGLLPPPQTLRRVLCNVLRGVRLLAAVSSSSLSTKALLCFSPEPQFNFAVCVAIAHSCTHTQSLSDARFLLLLHTCIWTLKQEQICTRVN